MTTVKALGVPQSEEMMEGVLHVEVVGEEGVGLVGRESTLVIPKPYDVAGGVVKLGEVGWKDIL